jgi:unsaturated rhamnogalacturonyl hydrolase
MNASPVPSKLLMYWLWNIAYVISDLQPSGLLKTFIRNREDGKIDIVQTCASAGLGPAKDPSRTGTANYYLAGKDVTVVENEGKAVGTFILASLEYEMNHAK